MQVIPAIPAFNLENAMNFAREIIHLCYKYWSGFFFLFSLGLGAVGFVGFFWVQEAETVTTPKAR